MRPLTGLRRFRLRTRYPHQRSDGVAPASRQRRRDAQLRRPDLTSRPHEDGWVAQLRATDEALDGFLGRHGEDRRLTKAVRAEATSATPAER